MNLGEGINGFGVCMWENEILEGIKYTVQSMKHRLDNMLLFIHLLHRNSKHARRKENGSAGQRKGRVGRGMAKMDRSPCDEAVGGGGAVRDGRRLRRRAHGGARGGGAPAMATARGGEHRVEDVVAMPTVVTRVAETRRSDGDGEVYWRWRTGAAVLR